MFASNLMAAGWVRPSLSSAAFDQNGPTVKRTVERTVEQTAKQAVK